MKSRCSYFLPLIISLHCRITASRCCFCYQESLSTRDITQLLSLLGALGTSPTEDNFPKEQALRKQSHSSSRFQDSHHDVGTHTEESSPETQYVRDESRQESSRKTYSNSVDRVGLGRPSSAPTKARQWSSDVRTDYSIVRNKPPTSQLNEESSSLDDNKNNTNVLSSRRIAQLSLRLHKDAERRLNERRDMVNSSPGKIMRPQPELSSTTKIMTEDLAPFQERQQTYMLRKLERMVSLQREYILDKLQCFCSIILSSNRVCLIYTLLLIEIEILH